VPQRQVDNRVLPVPRGRVLGGCSSINGMVYFRGHAREYDEWQQPGWSYADLLPYFQRLENYEAAHTPQRQRGGPVNVIDIPKPNPLVGRFLAAAIPLACHAAPISTEAIRKVSARGRRRSATAGASPE